MKNIEKIACSGLMLSLIIFPRNVLAVSKDETVYTTIDKNKELYKSVVVNHLYDISDKEEYEDTTLLKDILNLNGKEKFSINGNNIKWDNKGKEIFYQGVIDKELPINIDIKYYLDGKEMKESEMIGKKGNVKIVIELENKDMHTVTVNGNVEELYTPFVVTAGTIIKSANNSNIEVSNGRVVATGSKNILVSMASPGLYDSLGLEEFKGMDSIIISYDTTNYKENSLYLVATPKLIDGTDLKVFDKMNSVVSDVDKLQTNMDLLESGASKLEEGASKLVSGSREISDNLEKIVSYMKELEKGSLELNSGLRLVISKLSNVQELLMNGDTEGSIASLMELKSGNENAINNLNNTNTTIKNLFMTNGIDIDSIGVDSLPLDLVSYKKTYDGNNQLIYLLGLNNTAIDKSIATTKNTSLMIKELLTELNNGLTKLENGSNLMYSSIVKIRGGVEALYNGSVTLERGVNTLYNGVDILSNGISTYNTEGINKLSSGINQVTYYKELLENLVKLSDEYKGFGTDNADSTTFVTVIK